MRYPDVLIRTFTYAFEYLTRERLEHPENAAHADAQRAQVTDLLCEIAAALHGLDTTNEPASSEQLEDAQMWMLRQFNDPLKDVPPDGPEQDT